MSPDYKSPYAYRFKKSMTSKEWPIVRALIKGEVVTSEEIEFVRDDKKRIHLRVNAAPIRNKNKTKNSSSIRDKLSITSDEEKMMKNKTLFQRKALSAPKCYCPCR